MRSLVVQLDASEHAMVRTLADKEELEGEKRFLRMENKELADAPARYRATGAQHKHALW